MNKTKKYIKPCIEITIVEVSNGILESTYIDIGGTGGKPFDTPEYGEYLVEEYFLGIGNSMFPMPKNLR